MKKALSLILVLVLCLFLYACGNTPGLTEPPTTPPTEPSATATTVAFPESEPTVNPARQELLDTLTSCANTLGSSHTLSRFSFSYFQDGELVILEGMDADICIFDADKIKDNSEFTNCNVRAHGLNFVIIGGEIVAESAVHNGKRMGKLILRH